MWVLLLRLKPKMLLLGSGELGKEVVIEAHRLGVETIAVDRYDNAPAMQVAHRSYCIDMLDAEALKQLIRKENLITSYQRSKRLRQKRCWSLKKRDFVLCRRHVLPV